MTTLRAGSATDVGQIRSINQDSTMIVADDDLYGVADGMGGHQGGEVASAMAVEITTTFANEPSLESLKTAVRVANRAIFERAGGDRDLHGMGTTLVAVRLVEGEDGDEIAWVNVGDSRLYLLRDDRMVQLSEDHSLVEDLLRDGQITEEEAAVHPQRNILTRALGIDLDVKVDGNTVQPFVGDRYLLCSDGLFNEVSLDDIASVLRRIGDPDQAAADLVRQANEGGGRDNITVVIVDVVEDGGRAEAASAALAAAAAAKADDTATIESVTPEPRTVPVDDPGDGGDEDGGPVFAGAKSSLPEAETSFDSETDDLYRDLTRARGRHITWRVIAFLLVLAIVGGVVVGAIGWSASRTYYVGFENDQVTLYQGKPGGILWFDPKKVGDRNITQDETIEPFRSQIEANKQFGSRSDAEAFLRNLREQVIESQEASTTTTSTSTTTTAVAPTTVAPTTAPVPPTTAGP